ncbi:hypothetical protein D3Y55_27605 [Mesorhizobium sp. DCY119]|nr:hypothetical protein D3Y55_27605 [Mesorhizobium sp. DCY119]
MSDDCNGIAARRLFFDTGTALLDAGGITILVFQREPQLVSVETSEHRPTYAFLNFLMID